MVIIPYSRPWYIIKSQYLRYAFKIYYIIKSLNFELIIFIFSYFSPQLSHSWAEKRYALNLVIPKDKEDLGKLVDVYKVLKCLNQVESLAESFALQDPSVGELSCVCLCVCACLCMCTLGCMHVHVSFPWYFWISFWASDGI